MSKGFHYNSRNYEIPCKNCGEYTHNDFCSRSCISEYESIYGAEKFETPKYNKENARAAMLNLIKLYDAKLKKEKAK